jgi:hypothetical protein
MYEVALHAEPQQFLDWDKPLSQQSEWVRQKLEAANFVPHAARYNNSWDALFHPDRVMLGSFGKDAPKQSQVLREAGIPGIRYKDQLSRGKEGGSYNYVVFPGAEDLIEIIGKDGKPLKGAEKAKAVKELYALQGMPLPDDQEKQKPRKGKKSSS